ncbi:hypothetical protein BBO01nite_24500 [Brevibacillus borstelensis]|nr:hypothetical protein BBO01nite_24500 [Brevibacillus borstelensis]
MGETRASHRKARDKENLIEHGPGRFMSTMLPLGIEKPVFASLAGLYQWLWPMKIDGCQKGMAACFFTGSATIK